MASRYDQVFAVLQNKREEDLRICKCSMCACKGCCGTVGAKKVTQQELDLYLSGEMKKLLTPKPTIVSNCYPKLEQRFIGVTKNFDDMPDGTFINTSPVVEMDILEKWVRTESGSTYYYEKAD